MRSRLNYVGSTAKKRMEEHKKTVRRSRRLALKRKRQRRISAGDAMGVSPTREMGANLREAAAEQYALAAALNEISHEERKDRMKSITTGDNRLSSSHFRALFDSSNDDQTTEDSQEMDVPNTEDRRFIKPDAEEDSDGEYEPTDPGELSLEDSLRHGPTFDRLEDRVRRCECV